MKDELVTLRTRLGYMLIQPAGMLMIKLLCELLDKLPQDQLDEILKRHKLK